MKADEFREYRATLTKLTPQQRKQLIKELRVRESREESLQMIEARATDKPACPHCGNAAVRFGVIDGLQRYRCKHAECRKTFNALTGTQLSRLRHKDKWLEYTQTMQTGHSLRQSAQVCGIHVSTAFRWRHRFLAVPQGQMSRLLTGIAEADETYFLDSGKGSRRMARESRKRGGKAAKRGLSEEQIPVLICRDRTGGTADFVLEKADSVHVGAALKPIIAKDAMLCTDGGKALCAVAKEIGIPHKAVNLAAGIRVLDGVYHVQNVNAYDSRLKEWMRRFHGVATKYLPNYLGWRRLIERHQKLSPSPQAILAAALGLDERQYLVRI